MNEQIFHKRLVERYTSKTASDDELKVFFMLLAEGKLDEFLGDISSIADPAVAARSEALTKEPVPIRSAPVAPRFITIRRAAVAACIIGLVSLGIFLAVTNNAPPKKHVIVRNEPPAPPKTIQPGTNRATLTLADGSSIVLDNAPPGRVGVQRNVNVVKVDSGLLAYQVNTHAPPDDNPLYNTITVPRGGSYRVALPDGTMVWLNAASTMRFPTSFTTGKRIVEFEGEGYFEVAPRSSMPFVVQIKNDVSVQVLGTSFNVHCYRDEPVEATLLKGSIKVQSPRRSAILRPGQAAIVKEDSGLLVKSHADTAQTVAWKNGLFEFDRADLATILRQIERWYNVEVIYQGKKSKKEFVGKMPRNSNLSQVLQILELSNVHVRVEGTKLFVTSENE